MKMKVPISSFNSFMSNVLVKKISWDVVLVVVKFYKSILKAENWITNYQSEAKTQIIRLPDV